MVGVLEHVAEEADVLRPGLADHVSESKRDSLERVILCKPCKKASLTGISKVMKRDDDRRTEFGNGLRGRLIRRRALRLGPADVRRVRLPRRSYSVLPRSRKCRASAHRRA